MRSIGDRDIRSFGSNCSAQSQALQQVGDTLLVLDLHERFDDVGLKNWFEEWQDNGLLFLSLIEAPQNLEPRYNIAPTQRAAVVPTVRDSGCCRWGV